MTRLRLLKKKRDTVGRIRKIVKGLEIISLQKTYVETTQLEALGRYFDAAKSIINKAIHLGYETPWFLKPVPYPKRNIVIVFGITKGLVGLLQPTLTGFLKRFIAQQKHQETELILVGAKTYATLKPIVDQGNKNIKLTQVREEEAFSELEKTLVGSQREELGRVQVIYSHFVNMATHEIRLENLLPLEEGHKTAIIYPKLSRTTAKAMFNKLLIMLLEAKLLLASAHARASESGSRYIAMHAASIASEKAEQELTTKYNKVRQAKITQELTEINNTGN